MAATKGRFATFSLPWLAFDPSPLRVGAAWLRVGRAAPARLRGTSRRTCRRSWRRIPPLLGHRRYRLRLRQFLWLRPLVALATLPNEWRLCKATCARLPGELLRALGMLCRAVPCRAGTPTFVGHHLQPPPGASCRGCAALRLQASPPPPTLLCPRSAVRVVTEPHPSSSCSTSLSSPAASARAFDLAADALRRGASFFLPMPQLVAASTAADSECRCAAPRACGAPLRGALPPVQHGAWREARWRARVRRPAACWGPQPVLPRAACILAARAVQLSSRRPLNTHLAAPAAPPLSGSHLHLLPQAARVCAARVWPDRAGAAAPAR